MDAQGKTWIRNESDHPNSRPSRLRPLMGVALLTLATLLLGACATKPEPLELTIQQLKGAEAERYVGDTVTVEGIFVRDPLPMLVTELELVMINTPMPDDRYIVLMGPIAERLDPAELGGARLSVNGIFNATPDDDDDEPYKLDLKAYGVIDHMTQYNPKFVDMVIDPSTVKPDRYAILFSGGLKPAKNFSRYWNELKFMYSTLVNKYGFDKDHIAVLYGDGKAPDKQMPVHYAGTESDLSTAFSLLRKVSTKNDLIVFFATNHGGGFYKADKLTPHFYGGGVDIGGDEGTESVKETDYKIDFNNDGDKTDQLAWDETLIGYGPGDDIMDDDFAALFQGLKYKHLVAILEPCFSGGLIRDITQGTANRLVMSAAGQYEFSWVKTKGKGKGDYDEFAYHVISALNGAEPDGTTVKADSNKDGKVSIVEVFNYARSKDSQPETPYYDDNGDGVPHSGKMPSSGDGKLGNKVSLK